jgi:hypothetical protein
MLKLPHAISGTYIYTLRLLLGKIIAIRYSSLAEIVFPNLTLMLIIRLRLA